MMYRRNFIFSSIALFGTGFSRQLLAQSDPSQILDQIRIKLLASIQADSVLQKQFDNIVISLESGEVNLVPESYYEKLAKLRSQWSVQEIESKDDPNRILIAGISEAYRSITDKIDKPNFSFNEDSRTKEFIQSVEKHPEKIFEIFGAIGVDALLRSNDDDEYAKQLERATNSRFVSAMMVPIQCSPGEVLTTICVEDDNGKKICTDKCTRGGGIILDVIISGLILYYTAKGLYKLLDWIF